MKSMTCISQKSDPSINTTFLLIFIQYHISIFMQNHHTLSFPWTGDLQNVYWGQPSANRLGSTYQILGHINFAILHYRVNLSISDSNTGIDCLQLQERLAPSLIHIHIGSDFSISGSLFILHIFYILFASKQQNFIWVNLHGCKSCCKVEGIGEEVWNFDLFPFIFCDIIFLNVDIIGNRNPETEDRIVEDSTWLMRFGRVHWRYFKPLFLLKVVGVAFALPFFFLVETTNHVDKFFPG